jgi:hypothetical protein
VGVAGLVHVVVAARLEEDVARLARHHAHQPAHGGGGRRVDEQHGAQKADRAEQVQALVDAALVVVAVVVPAQGVDFPEEITHGKLLGNEQG